MYIFPKPGILHAQLAAERFGMWAQANNSAIEHWAARWGEPGLASFAAVTLLTVANHTANMVAKAGDFWRFWLLGVLKEGTYGVSVGEV